MGMVENSATSWYISTLLITMPRGSFGCSGDSMKKGRAGLHPTISKNEEACIDLAVQSIVVGDRLSVDCEEVPRGRLGTITCVSKERSKATKRRYHDDERKRHWLCDLEEVRRVLSNG